MRCRGFLRAVLRCGGVRAAVAGLAGAILLACGAMAAPPADQDGFTRWIAERLALGLPAGMTITIKAPLTLAAGARGEPPQAAGSIQINLDRPWRACQRDRDACDGIVTSYLRDAQAVLRHQEEPATRDGLRLVLRPGSYLASLPNTDPAKTPVSRPFPGGMLVMCVMDSPRSVRSVGSADLDALGLTADQGLDLAARNTGRELVAPASLDAVQAGRHTVIAGGFYESSRLLLTGQWNSLAARFGGKLLVAVPDNATIIVGDGRQPGMLATMREAARTGEGHAQRPLSAAVLEWTPSGWREAAG